MFVCAVAPQAPQAPARPPTSVHAGGLRASQAQQPKPSTVTFTWRAGPRCDSRSLQSPTEIRDHPQIHRSIEIDPQVDRQIDPQIYRQIQIQTQDLSTTSSPRIRIYDLEMFSSRAKPALSFRPAPGDAKSLHKCSPHSQPAMGHFFGARVPSPTVVASPSWSWSGVVSTP